MAKVMSRFASLSTTAVFCICIGEASGTRLSLYTYVFVSCFAVTCGASQAFLSWSSLVCNTSNAITNVTISNGNINISLPAGGLTVNLTEDNGPGKLYLPRHHTITYCVCVCVM